MQGQAGEPGSHWHDEGEFQCRHLRVTARAGRRGPETGRREREPAAYTCEDCNLG